MKKKTIFALIMGGSIKANVLLYQSASGDADEVSNLPQAGVNSESLIFF